MQNFQRIKKKYQTLKEIDKGAYGIVYLVRDMENGKTWAKKEIEIEDFSDFLELDFLSRFKHPFINDYREWYIEKRDKKYYLSLIFPLAISNLYSYLITYQDFPLTDIEKERLMLELVSCLKFIHSQGYYYGDLKSSNILVFEDDIDETLSFKLCDFSLTNAIENNTSFTGSPLFTSPQGLVNNIKKTLSQDSEFKRVFYEKLDHYQADLFSLGIMLYLIYSDGSNPLASYAAIIKTKEEKINENELYIKVYSLFIEEYQEYFLKKIPDNSFRDLIISLTHPSQNDRMGSILEVCNHPYFSGKIRDEGKVLNNKVSIRDIETIPSKDLSRFISVINGYYLKYSLSYLCVFTTLEIFIKCFSPLEIDGYDKVSILAAALTLGDAITQHTLEVEGTIESFNIKEFSYNFCPYCGDILSTDEIRCCQKLVHFNFKQLIIQMLALLQGKIRTYGIYDIIKDKDKDIQRVEIKKILTDQKKFKEIIEMI